MNGFRWRMGVAATTAVLFGASPSFAQTTHTVQLLGTSVFSPSSLTIEAGDTVHWEWVAGMHNVVSGAGGVQDGNFDSGDAVFGATFDVTFDQSFLSANPMPDNEYPYYCEPHLFVGMTGMITVLPGVPAVSDWGIAVTAMLILTAGTVLLGRRRPLRRASPCG